MRFEIACMREHLGDILGLFQALSPTFFLHRTDDQILVSDRFRVILAEQSREQVFNFILMGDQ